MGRGPATVEEELVTGINERWACGQDQQSDKKTSDLRGHKAQDHKLAPANRVGPTLRGSDLGEIYASSRMPGPAEEEARRLIASTDRLLFDRCVGAVTM